MNTTPFPKLSALEGGAILTAARSLAARAASVAVSLWLGLHPPCAMAGTTYSYTGNNYNQRAGTYTNGGPYALSIRFATTLAGNALNSLTFTDITSTVTSYSFSDGTGLNLNNTNNVYGGFLIEVGTDAAGNITNWMVSTFSSNTATQMQSNWHSPYGFMPGRDFSETSASFSGSYGYISGNAGTWTATVIPPSGSLRVTLMPLIGARWQVDGGTAQPSAGLVAGLAAGNHTVSFVAVNGYTTPSNQTVTITANATNETTATYFTPQAQLLYITNSGAIWITGYTGAGTDLVIPPTITGLPVTSIGNYAFLNLSNLTSVTAPGSVTNIGTGALQGCTNLMSLAVGSNVTIFADVLLNHTATAGEKEFVDAEIYLDTSQIDPAGSLPVSGGGSVPVSVVRNRVYNLLLTMRLLAFSRPIPWTGQTLNQWFMSSCHSITIVTNGLSEADLANQRIYISAPPNSYLLLAGNWMVPSLGGGLVDTMALFVHEARHLNGLLHTSGYQDATLNELGAWAAESYFYKLAASCGNVTNSIMPYTSSTLLADAQSVLGWGVVNTQLTVRATKLTRQTNQVAITFGSPQPYSPHQLLKSSDLKGWNQVGAASFQVLGGSNVLATASAPETNNFYRIELLGL